MKIGLEGNIVHSYTIKVNFRLYLVVAIVNLI